MSAFGAIAGVALPLIGDAINYAANERTNYYNTLQVRESNELNKEMFEKQLQWNEDMYNKYSSPEALKKQYEAAGFNPYLMMNSGSAGSVSAGVSAPDMKPALNTAFQSQGLALAGKNLLDSELVSAQRDNIQAATDGMRIDNVYKELHHLGELQEQQSRVGVNTEKGRQIGEEIKALKIRLGYEHTALQSRTALEKAQADAALSEKHYKDLMSDYQQQINTAFPRLNQYQLNLLSAQSFAAIKSGLASQASADMTKEQQKAEAIKRIGLVLENGIKSGQFTLQQLGMSEHEIKSMVYGYMKDEFKRSPNYVPVTAGIDYLIDRLPILKGFK